jgi:competence protein ComEA
MNIFRHRVVLISFFLLILALVGRWWHTDQSSRRGTVIVPVTSTKPDSDYITVQIDGAVHVPGVYRITSDAHVMELIFLAGGLLPEARLGKINLAKILEDGDRVHVLGALKVRNKLPKKSRKKTS